MTTRDAPDEPLPVRWANTVRAERGVVHDAFDRSDGLRKWLRSNGFEVARQPSDRDLSAARALRDAVRALFSHVTGDDRPATTSPAPDVVDAVEVLEAHGRPTPPDRLELVDGELRLASPRPVVVSVEDALAQVRAQTVELLTGPGAADLRACHGPRCVLFFVRDHPRREWCSAACGNRARAARHYRRHRPGDEE